MGQHASSWRSYLLRAQISFKFLLECSEKIILDPPPAVGKGLINMLSATNTSELPGLLCVGQWACMSMGNKCENDVVWPAIIYDLQLKNKHTH